MKPIHLRSLMLTVGILSALTVAAAPAHALITPAGAFTMTSNNEALTSGFFTFRCPTSNYSGTVASDGLSQAGTITFGRAGATCTESGFGTSVTVACNAQIRTDWQASVAGTSASGDLVIPNGTTCTARSTVTTPVSVSGPQTARGCVTLRQGPPTTTVYNCRFRDTTGTSVTYSGTFTWDRNITIS